MAKQPTITRSLDSEDGFSEYAETKKIDRPADQNEQVQQIKVELITPNPHQPRTVFDDDELRKLADSIKESDIQQPLILTDNPILSGHYWIVTGGRRYKAATELVGLKTVPAIVRQATKEQLIVHAFIENDQREALNPIDEANALKQMKDELNLSYADLAKKVGKPKSSVAETVLLLDLNESIQDAVKYKRLDKTTALGFKPLFSYEKETEELLEKAVRETLSARQIKQEVERILVKIERRKRQKKQSPICVNEPVRLPDDTPNLSEIPPEINVNELPVAIEPVAEFVPIPEPINANPLAKITKTNIRRLGKSEALTHIGTIDFSALNVKDLHNVLIAVKEAQL